jgi:hypothetical protein
MKTNEIVLTADETRFFTSVALRAAKHTDLGMEAAMLVGIKEEIAFEDEILENKTRRAKMARNAIGAAAFAEINIQHAIEEMGR